MNRLIEAFIKIGVFEMMMNTILRNTILRLISVCLTASAALAQTTAFTYQGKLTDTGTPQATYQMEFRLFDALTGGIQVSSTVSNASVAVMQGVFTVPLDFGAAAFDGSARWLEIGVRPAGNVNPFTVLSPRQQLSSAPYSIKSMNSTATDSLSAACVGCVQDANILGVSGSKVMGEIPSQSVPTGSGNYIQNAATAARLGKFSPQQAAGFNIDGNGVIGDSLGVGIAPRAGIKLDVVGNVLMTQANGGAMQFGTPNSETGMSNIVGGGRADLRFDGTTLKLVVGPVGAPPSSTSGIVINTFGRVYIDTPFNSILAKLNVNAGNNDYAINARGNGAGVVAVYGENPDSRGFAGQFNGNVSIFNGILTLNNLSTMGGTPLCRNGLNQIAFCSSSLRYKKDLQPFGDGFSFINQLRPIAYKWKADNMSDIGFGAEDVAKINPLFVTYNDKGEVEGVKYDRLSTVFVNAFKEQQTQIEQQQKQLGQQQIQIESLKKLICLDHPNADVCQEK